MLARVLLLLICVWALPILAQQRAASEFEIDVSEPRFAIGSGPRVVIDEAHHNFHTLQGRFGPFAALLQADGYRVSPWRSRFKREALAEVDVLVIANALPPELSGDWSRPPVSAFSAGEIVELGAWVREDGGSLLLIADHQPFPATAADLAREFGFLFYNGYVLDRTRKKDRGFVTFTPGDGSLLEHPITSGDQGFLEVPSVTLFTGQALLAPETARPLLRLGARHQLYLPGPDRRITPDTRSITVETWLQGATLEAGRGRVAVFGEAGGFTAQKTRAGGTMGMNHPAGLYNDEFVLNTLRWLSPR